MNDKEIIETSNSLLEVGSLLMESGASTHRIRITIERLGAGLGYSCETLITHKTIFLLLRNNTTDELYNSFKKTPPHSVNFTLVSEISKLSWKVVEGKLLLKQLQNEVIRIKNIPRYSFIYVLIFVSFAGAGFCRLFGGMYLDMLIAFIATFFGFIVRHYTAKIKFNIYLSISFAALTASLIAGGSTFFNDNSTNHLAFATSVLFLIPGVPLINSFSDLMDGYTMNGIVRGAHAMLIALFISLGMFVAMLIYDF
ncbi:MULTISPECIES: threonine/serine exporter ThrE family protein [unclassified Polaribacter]|uniref:threonine/serine ThrE exporter family protein n=1 Tax=unclassified Polaribacter TaxID=196858 RepID=UPI00140B999D|nr:MULTISPECIES: threonine/serine exporter family protein [unclassified Polaribacter]